MVFTLDSSATISDIDREQVKLTNSLIQTEGMRVYTVNGSSLNLNFTFNFILNGRMNIEINFQNLIFQYELYSILIVVDKHYLVLNF